MGKLIVSVIRTLFFGFLLAAAVAGAGEGSLDRYLPGWKMARFLPLQGRMVLEHDGEMLVVRSGEKIPGLPGASVKTIGSGGALIEIDEAPDVLDAAQEPTKRWLLVKSASDGTIQVIMIHSMPEEGLLPELSVETEEIPVSRPSSTSTLKHLPEDNEGNIQ